MSRREKLHFAGRHSRATAAILFLVLSSSSLGLRASQVNFIQAQLDRELAIYAKGRTVVDMTVEELLRDYPRECGDLEFDDNQAELKLLLSKTGACVEALVRDIPNTGAKEQVRRERLRSNGSVDSTATQNYNYLVLPGQTGLWEEIRTDNKGRPLPAMKMDGRSFLTSGFASTAIFFHPQNQGSSRFRILGRQRAKPEAFVIAFAQKPEIGTPAGRFETELTLEPALLLCQGWAWIDHETFQILKMRTDLLAPRSDILLSRQITEISYQEVHFADIPQAFWLPSEVLVTIEWNGQIYRNRHRYSEYLVFSVESRDKLEQPKIKKVMRTPPRTARII
jgi:hypothetical protein